VPWAHFPLGRRALGRFGFGTLVAAGPASAWPSRSSAGATANRSRLTPSALASLVTASILGKARSCSQLRRLSIETPDRLASSVWDNPAAFRRLCKLLPKLTGHPEEVTR
jgi:hypothetical protein